MKERILVTGGAGYLGSTLVPMLLEKGYSVKVVDNVMYGQTSLNHVCHHPKFTVIRGDVRVTSTMRELLRDVDIIIPLAAYVGAPLCDRDPVGAKTTNHDAILKMLELVSTDQRILMPTTNSAYGSGDEKNYCNEMSPLKPISTYAKDKVKVEQSLLEHKNSISFRLATVFGMSPRMRLDLLVNDFVYRAVKDRFIVLFESHFKRNYIHVSDVARVFVHGILNFDSMAGEIFNVGLSDANLSKTELCQRIKAHVDDFVFVEENIAKDPDGRNYVVSNDKIERTGFATQVSIDDGIVELVKGYEILSNTKYGNV